MSKLIFEAINTMRHELSLGLYRHETPDGDRVEATMRALTNFVDARLQTQQAAAPSQRRTPQTSPPDSVVEIAYAAWLRARDLELFESRECVRSALAAALQHWLTRELESDHETR